MLHTLFSMLDMLSRTSITYVNFIKHTSDNYYLLTELYNRITFCAPVNEQQMIRTQVSIENILSCILIMPINLSVFEAIWSKIIC